MATAIVAVTALGAALGSAGAATGRSAAVFDGAKLEVVSNPIAPSQLAVGFDFGDEGGGLPPTAARVDLTIPTGYALDLSGRTGSRVGDVFAIAVPANGTADLGILNGPIVVIDPAAYAADPVAQACSPGSHAAYWSVSLDAAGGAVDLPIAVDTTSNADGTTSYAAHFCPLARPTPTRPTSLSLVASFIDFSQIGTPSTAATYQWSALVTPASPGSLDPAPASTFELRTDVPTPQVLTLHARYDAKTHTAVLNGQLVGAGRPRAGAILSIARGSDPQHATQATTGPDGTFLVRTPIARTEQFSASIGDQPGPCVAPSAAPGGCRNESVAGTASLTAVIVLPRPTDPTLSTKAHDQALARRSVLTAADLPGAQVVGDGPPPCAAFTPDLHRLTETGQQRSPLFLTADRTAEVYATASVFGKVADAKTDDDAATQRNAALCDINDFASVLGVPVASVKKLALPKIGNDARGYRATLTGQGGPTFVVDVLIVRVSRVVITLHVLTLGPSTGLDLTLARALARRAR